MQKRIQATYELTVKFPLFDCVPPVETPCGYSSKNTVVIVGSPIAVVAKVGSLGVHDCDRQGLR
jgi:hypothetical protein